jgi:hypothetical protein
LQLVYIIRDTTIHTHACAKQTNTSQHFTPGCPHRRATALRRAPTAITRVPCAASWRAPATWPSSRRQQVCLAGELAGIGRCLKPACCEPRMMQPSRLRPIARDQYCSLIS